jgi:hypothetical protein
MTGNLSHWTKTRDRRRRRRPQGLGPKQEGFSNMRYRYDWRSPPDIGAVVSQSPAAGISGGCAQPVSLKPQANSC